MMRPDRLLMPESLLLNKGMLEYIHAQRVSCFVLLWRMKGHRRTDACFYQSMRAIERVRL